MNLIRCLCLIVIGVFAASKCSAQEPLQGSLSAHDPSTMIKHGGHYYIFYTGQNISSKSSADRINWSAGPSVFSNSTRPSWTTNWVPDFTGNFWAPDIIYLNGLYHLYYSVSTFGSQLSGIGLVTNPTLDPADPNYLWTDQGPVIQSNGSVNFNAIDPGVLLAADGRMWMTFGSFWTGIKMIELDPATGKRITPSSTISSLATHPPSTAIEGACLIQRSNYFYLFVNWDTCCSGLNSTYNIRVGRSLNVTGPYLDRSGVGLASGGGSLLLESTGRFLGPGHAGVLVEGETNWFTYHYYDGNNNGSSRLGMGRLYWSADGWPQITNDWCAFYPFNTDAREHLAVYNGQLQSGATITNEPERGRVLSLDGAGQYATLPLSVANAGTFAAWVKWNGGAAWQRIFDFGNGTNRYLFLTPREAGGRMRFAATTNGALGEQVINAPTALATGSWCHVAVTLDGTRGLLYLNGTPIATNNSFNRRPWHILARTNYLGESQKPADPPFNGRIDSLRIFGRALNANEIKTLSQAHPSLAHRYSFAADASDTIGTAHGRLAGAAVVSNNVLTLDGSAGTYVKLPGGIVSGSSAVTLEFQATFGANGNWSRVFDFGNTNGVNGQQFLFFSPHTGVGSHRIGISTTSTIDFDVSGTLDGRTVHVACIVDPPGSYTAIYTNGVLEREWSGSVPPLSNISSALSFLGRSLFAADAWLNATIDEFRIYDGRLTPEEIAANFAAGPEALALPIRLEAAAAPAAITLSWPAYAAGFVLQESPSVGVDAGWSPVVSAPALMNDLYQLTLPVTGSNQFFRLQR